MKKARTEEAVLAFNQVSITGDDVPRFDLSLAAGELVAFELSNSNPPGDIAGIAAGVTLPGHGSASFLGKLWSQCSEDQATAQRLQIGQVFNSQVRASWIENLDIDENIYLARQMIGSINQPDLVEHATGLAHQFGLEGIPAMRRSAVASKNLMRAQWVRAFLPDPLRLLILERPTLGMDTESVNLLLQQIARVRGEGTAVLWLDNALSQAENDILSPTHLINPTPSSLQPASTS